jgi:hypothetical protein
MPAAGRAITPLEQSEAPEGTNVERRDARQAGGSRIMPEPHLRHVMP